MNNANSRIRQSAIRWPSPKRRRLQAACLLLATTLFWPAVEVQTEAATAGSGVEEIKKLIGRATCKVDADCRTLAIGEKSCGGPEAYAAWSVRDADARALSAAAARYRTKRQASHKNGPTSNCAFVADPGAQCTGGSDGTGNGVDDARRVCTLGRTANAARSAAPRLD